MTLANEDAISKVVGLVAEVEVGACKSLVAAVSLATAWQQLDNSICTVLYQIGTVWLSWFVVYCLL